MIVTPMLRVWLGVCLFLLVLSGCGPEAALWLRIGAPLAAPEHIDELRVDVTWDDENGPSAFGQTYTLDDGDRFPLTLSLTAQELGESGSVHAVVRGYKDRAPAPPGPGGGWASASGSAKLQKGRFVELELLMREPPR